jgi:hypothetical protein
VSLDVPPLPTVTVRIPTDDLHRALPRLAAHAEAAAAATARGLVLVGDHLTGPRIRGPLDRDHIELVWRARRPLPRPPGAAT